MKPTAFSPVTKWRWCALLVLTLGVASCSGPARGRVRGKVTLRGQPVTDSTILFENAHAGVGTTAEVGAGGMYEVTTYQGNGLPPGPYKVAIYPGTMMKAGNEIPLAGKEPPRKKDATVIPARYLKTATSQLSVEVKANDNPPFDFDLVP